MRRIRLDPSSENLEILKTHKKLISYLPLMIQISSIDKMPWISWPCKIIYHRDLTAEVSPKLVLPYQDLFLCNLSKISGLDCNRKNLMQGWDLHRICRTYHKLMNPKESLRTHFQELKSNRLNWMLNQEYLRARSSPSI